jgi:hypothetical protein
VYPELGAGTSPVLDTSPGRQADWIDAVFGAWDVQIDRIGLIAFTWLHGLTPEAVQAVVEDPAFGAGVPPADSFVELVRTLGLRTDAGDAKPAFHRLVARANERGWVDTGRRCD